MSEKAEPEAEPAGSASRLAEILDPSWAAFVRRAKLSAGAELGKKAKKARQKRLRHERQEATATLTDKVAIGNMAEEVGLTVIALSGLQLRGALLSIAADAKYPDKLASFEKVGQAWLTTRRPARDPSRLPVFVTATTIGAEMAEACRELRLRRVKVPKGFSGSLTTTEAVNLGKRFAATVQVEYGDADRLLLSAASSMQRSSARLRPGSALMPTRPSARLPTPRTVKLPTPPVISNRTRSASSSPTGAARPRTQLRHRPKPPPLPTPSRARPCQCGGRRTRCLITARQGGRRSSPKAGRRARPSCLSADQ